MITFMSTLMINLMPTLMSTLMTLSQVQTDCSTPALANYGSDRLKREFLVPALSGDAVTSIAVVPVC